MIPKEIQEAIADYVTKSFKTPVDAARNSGLANHLYEAVKFGYQLATDGREEENVTVEYWQKLYGEAHQLLFDANTKITTLQSRLDSVDSRNYNLLEENEKLQSQCTEKDQEIEALKSV